MTRPLRVGHIELSFHDAASEQVELLLRSHGHEIERSAAPHKDMFASLGRGEVDLLVAAWLPWSHGVYYNQLADRVRPITVLYEPYAIWAVPDYVPAEVVSIEDLLRSPAVDRMDRLIQGMAPGAGISEMSPKAVEAYGLDAAGYHFENGSEDDCIGRLASAIAKEKWIVTPVASPTGMSRSLGPRSAAQRALARIANPVGPPGGAAARGGSGRPPLVDQASKCSLIVARTSSGLALQPEHLQLEKPFRPELLVSARMFRQSP